VTFSLTQCYLFCRKVIYYFHKYFLFDLNFYKRQKAVTMARRLTNTLSSTSNSKVSNPSSTSLSPAEVSYVVKCDLVESSLALSGHIPAAYTPTALSRVITDINSPSQQVTFAQWVDVAQTQLGVSPHVASSLFNAFLVTTQSKESQLEYSRVYLSHKDRSEDAALKFLHQRTALAPPFMLFLYLQLFQRNTYIHNAADAWVGGAGSARQLALTTRSHDGEAFLTFVRRHLYDLLLCTSMGNYKITSNDVQHLGLLLHEKPPAPTSTCFGANLPFWVAGTGSVEVSVLHTYLQQHVAHSATWYPPLELPIAGGKLRVLWPDPGTAPSTHVALIARVQGLFTRSVALPSYVSLVVISSCSQCTIYLLCPLPNVSVIGCINVTLVLGAVAGTLAVEECDMVKVVATCGGCRVVNTTGARLHLCSNTQPTIHGLVKGVQMAPYSTHYNMLEADMKTCGLNPLLNFATSFLTMVQGMDATLLPPEEFTPIMIPIQAPPRYHGCPSTVYSPCVLPPVYAKSVQKVTEAFNTSLHSIQRVLALLHADGSEKALATAAAFRQKVEAQFSQWVASSGQQRAVLDMLLVPPEK